MDLALVNGARSFGRRAVSQERGALHLLDVVEARDADVAVREGSLMQALHFREDFVRVGGSRTWGAST